MTCLNEDQFLFGGISNQVFDSFLCKYYKDQILEPVNEDDGTERLLAKGQDINI